MINVGVLGLAHGHVFSYGSRWQNDPSYGIKITGVWDKDPARAVEGAKNLGGDIIVFSSANELLSSDISAVVISSETAYHADLCEAAAAAGKDIIMYKPMALTMKDADRIVKAVSDSGVKFTVAWQMRMDKQNRFIRDMIQNGELGTICAYRRRHGLSTHTWAGFENTWHVAPEMNRDIFADDSAHPADMLQWIFGVPESVSAELTTRINPRVPNDNGVALYRYSDGLVAEISCCFTCLAAEATTEVYGADGVILQSYGDAVSTSLARPEDQPGLKFMKKGDSSWTDSGIASPKSHSERIAGEAGPLAAFLKGETGSICTAEEGRNSLAMVLAAELSSSIGERVKITDERIYNL